LAVETITTVLVAATATPPAGAYDLTDLATVRDELSLKTDDTSNDAFLSRAITQSSRAIANYCNRVFPVETVQDVIYIQQDPYPYQVPGGVYPLQLARWPLVNSGVVVFTGNTMASQVITGIASTAGITQGQPIFASDGSLPIGTTVSAVYPTSLLLSNASSSRTAGVNFTTGVQVVQTLEVGQMQALVYGTDFTIDAKRGWLIRLNSWTGVSEKWEALPVTVQYQAGYSPIPDDLVDACLRLVTARFRTRGRDPTVVERGQPGMVGSERYWVGTPPGQKGAFPPEITSLIDQYRVPVMA
jgi:hypothetical protein